METLADYERWKSSKQQNSVGAAQVVLGSVEEAPDQVAGDLNLANEFGKVTGNPVPTTSLVKEYRSVFQQAVERERAKTTLSSSPRLTEWLRNPENAALSRDDLDNMSWFEGFGRGTTATLQRSGQRLGQAGNQYMLNQTAGRAQDRRMGFGDILESERKTVTTSSGDVRLLPTLTDFMSAAGRWIDAKYADAIGTDDEAAARGYASALQGNIDKFKAIPKSTIAQDAEASMFKDGATFGQVMQNVGGTMLSNPLGVMSWALETAGESAPQLAAAVGVTVATRNPTAGIITSGAGSYLTERYVSPADFLAEKGINLGKPEDVGRILSDPTLLKEANDRGIIRGTVIAAFDMVSFGIAGKRLARNPLVEAFGQGLQQAINGALGEYSARVAAGQEIDWNEIIAEGLAEIATAPVDMGIAGRSLAKERQRAKAAEGTVAQIGEIAAQAGASKLRERMPDKFRQFVEAATANGPVENVYIPGETFAQYFQGIGVDPFELIGDFEGVDADDLRAAIASGGDLRIPTATYAAKIAGSEHDAFFIDNMMFDHDGKTAAQAVEFNERADEIMQETWEAAEAARVEAEEFRSMEEQIFDSLVSRLRVAGQSTDVSTAAATLYPAFYRTMAQKHGMTTDEMLGRYRLPEIAGSLPQGMQFRDVDELNRTLAEARTRKTTRESRTSLLEWISDYGGINDQGGELRARDAEVVRRGKGKKSLKLARGGIASGMRDLLGATGGKKFGADDVARAAIEAGYLADDPVANEYRAALAEGREIPDISRPLWDAIDRELRGEGQFATDPQAEAQADQEAHLDEMESYLSSLGVSLSDDDATIRQALEGVKQYAQDTNGPRGFIQFPSAGVGNGDTVIRLFENSNLSTFLHESGHYFLTVMQDMAREGGPVADDFATVKAWWGENAKAVASDARRAMPDVAVTEADVTRFLAEGSTGDVMLDGAIDVGMQEQFARSFEAYLMEGKAPSADLRGVFEKFRSWLISVYQKLAGLNVAVSDNMRAVFDRMLATDEEIAKAQADAGGVGPVFATAEEMGLSPEDYAAFMKLRSQAEDEAKARLLRETMAPIKRAQEKEFKAERAKVREEVEREVNAFPYFRAIEWMGNRRWFGDSQPEDMPDMRLSKDILVDRYGAGVLSTLPRGKQTVYAVEGGIDPDDAAGWFGFDSGDEMVRAMEKAPKRNDAIEAETDRVMRERHGDALNDGSIEAEALDAVHNDKRGQWIAAELKAVVEIAGTGVGLTAKDARAGAKTTIARMRVRDAMASERFLAAERKAAEEAARLGAQLARDKVWLDAAKRKIATSARAAVRGDASPDAAAKAVEDYNARFETTTSTFTVGEQQRTAKSGKQFTIPGGERTATSYGYNDLVARLIEVKRRQLVNHALYMEARKVAEEVEAAERLVTKLNKKTTRERIAGAGRRDNAQVDYLGAIDELLTRYDFRRLSGAAEQRRGALAAFVEAMKAQGRENEIAIPETVMADAGRKPYKTIPVEELRGVVDSLKNIEHIATRWNDLIDAIAKRKMDEVTADIVAAFDANVAKRPPGRVGSKSEALRTAGRQFLDLVLNATTLLREIDGFKDMGAAYRNIKSPIDDAMTRLITRKEKAAGDLEALYEVYSKEERRRMAVREHMPELGYALSKWEKIAVALNTGNEGNFQRLTDPKVRGHLTEPQVQAVLATLDEKDADFIQSVWDYVGTFKGDIEAREKRTTGVAPAWVEASPVTIAGKTLKGGYYPLKYDSRLSLLARDDEHADLAKGLQSGRFGKAQTKNGHTKARAQSSGRAVELDMSVLHRHVNQVIYDLELSEPVANSWRILQDSRIRTAFMDAGKSADFDALEIWLQDVGNGELRSADLVNRGSRLLKSNFTAAKLAFNLSTVALQITGVSQSMVIVGKKNMAVGISQAAKNPIAAAAEVAGRSAFMKTRQTTFNKDIYDFYSDPKTGPAASRWGDIKKEIIGPMSFWLMTKVQWHLVDVPTWLAGYRQGLQKFGNDEAKAVAHADDIVKRAQASGLFSDRSAIERGSLNRTSRQNDVVRLFTALGSYMFAKFNVAYERSAVASRTIKREGVSMASAQEALSWTLDMAFLFTLEALVGAAIKGKLPDDDDDDDEGWTKFLAKETALSVMGTVPFIRDVASPLQGFDGGGAYGAITKEVATPVVQALQGEVDKAFVKSVINATGLATGLPATQINRAVDGLWRRSEGEDVAPLEYLLGKSKK